MDAFLSNNLVEHTTERLVVKLAQITDIHLGHRWAQRFGVDIKRNLIMVLDDIRRRGITEVVATGDIAEEEQASWFFNTIREYGLSVHIVLGNHDNPQAMELNRAYLHDDHYYYKIAADEATLLFCDSRMALVDERQLYWLKNEIASSLLPVQLFIHHPVLDCDDSFMDRKHALLNRDEIVRVLKDAGKEINVFCGHYHTNDERSDGSIHQYATPSIFYQIQKQSETLERENGPIGYRIITLGDGMTCQTCLFNS